MVGYYETVHIRGINGNVITRYVCYWWKYIFLYVEMSDSEIGDILHIIK
ncbi:MAG: hypothetical protein AMDU4_FER2C00336G0001 [Ferroplasma sp. Type II]|jgi:hypothetical protein|nr:hypothetical protein [Ferroplasma sp.]EQB67837.1 MAG: hypothetical protein AMDU4_FER2C00336G0001 [Ferroplasma sp. Type II]